jgi:S-adenosylmethionine-diacylglycerol 3-amino-3-carboxypropyl transferase
MEAMGFFQNLNFSSANEDGETELRALAGARRIVCLTGSGTRPLDMLLSSAEEVVALDINPVQNALLELKIVAIRTLGYEDLLAFLGIAKSMSRLSVYHELRPALSSASRTIWDQKRHMIKAGVWHAGKWEKLLLWNSRFLKLVRGRDIQKLMRAPDLETQARLWDEKFANSKLQTALEMIGRDWIWRWVMREPAGEFLPPPQEVGKRLNDDFSRAARTFLFRESDFAALIFNGRHDADGALPVHLRRENYDLLRSRLGSLRIVEGGLADLPNLHLGQFDGFSLSDFGSYSNREFYEECWKGILAVAAPEARYCERIFMNDLPLPFKTISIDGPFSAALSSSDKAIIYRIRTGQIHRAGDG